MKAFRREAPAASRTFPRLMYSIENGYVILVTNTHGCGVVVASGIKDFPVGYATKFHLPKFADLPVGEQIILENTD